MLRPAIGILLVLLLIAPATALAARTVTGGHLTGQFAVNGPFSQTARDAVHDPTKPYPSGPISSSEVGQPFTFSIQTTVPFEGTSACGTGVVDCRPAEVHMWNYHGGAYHTFTTTSTLSGTVPAGVNYWAVRAGTGIHAEWTLTFG